MAYWLLLAAAKKRHDDMARARSRNARLTREKREKMEEQRHWSSHSYHESSLPVDYPYIESVLAEMVSGSEDSKVLSDFFEKLRKHFFMAKAQEAIPYAKKNEEYIELFHKYDSEIKVLEETLKQEGIVTCDRSVSWYHYSYWHYSQYMCHAYECVMGKPLDCITGFSCEDPYRFHGIRFSREMLETGKDTTFREDYEKIKKENEPLREEKTQLEAQLAIKEKKLEKAWFGKDKKQEEISQIKRRISEIEGKIHDEEEKKKKMEFYESLTPEQRERMLKYADAVEAMRQLATASEKNMSEFGQTLVDEDKDNPLYLEKGIQLMEERGEITEEGLYKIFRVLDKVAIRRNRAEYDMQERGRWYSEYNNKYTKGIIKLFIERIYEGNGDFVENNIAETINVDREEA